MHEKKKILVRKQLNRAYIQFTDSFCSKKFVSLGLHSNETRPEDALRASLAVRRKKSREYFRTTSINKNNNFPPLR